jgi:hypothetical protein
VCRTLERSERADYNLEVCRTLERSERADNNLATLRSGDTKIDVAFGSRISYSKTASRSTASNEKRTPSYELPP